MKDRKCIFSTIARIRLLRLACINDHVPEAVQDGYEEIIDQLICLLGITSKQRELFWTLTDPE